EVNEAWSGLGYYSRGRRLFEGAQKVVSELKGEMPKTAGDLEKKLPGVGRYTAGAIASIAFGEVTGLVDGNVVRVLSRLRAIGANSTLPEVMDAFWKLSHELVDPEKPGDFNQAMMELGATVCTPKLPQCGQCPVRALCRAYARTENDKKTAAKRICTEVKKESNGAPEIIDIECLVPDCKFCLPSDAPWDKEPDSRLTGILFNGSLPDSW
ncbi:adenine DNA glycosylase, partial [Plakobranchus ocellatus]